MIRTSKRNDGVALRLVEMAVFTIAACALAIGQSLPQVQLDSDGLAPRAIEELTETTIARHYALAWSNLELALQSGRAENVGEEFVGFARDRLLQRVAEQRRTGLHVKVVDHGHHLKAVFYSTDGTALQLVDKAQLEFQTFDGNKLLDTESGPHEYLVLMTPGADRWYVRDLQEIPLKSF